MPVRIPCALRMAPSLGWPGREIENIPLAYRSRCLDHEAWGQNQLGPPAHALSKNSRQAKKAASNTPSKRGRWSHYRLRAKNAALVGDTASFSPALPPAM